MKQRRASWPLSCVPIHDVVFELRQATGVLRQALRLLSSETWFEKTQSDTPCNQRADQFLFHQDDLRDCLLVKTQGEELVPNHATECRFGLCPVIILAIHFPLFDHE